MNTNVPERAFHAAILSISLCGGVKSHDTTGVTLSGAGFAS